MNKKGKGHAGQPLCTRRHVRACALAGLGMGQVAVAVKGTDGSCAQLGHGGGGSGSLRLGLNCTELNTHADEGTWKW